MGVAEEENLRLKSERHIPAVFLLFLWIRHGQHINDAMLWQCPPLTLVIKEVMVCVCVWGGQGAFCFSFVICWNEKDILWVP